MGCALIDFSSPEGNLFSRDVHHLHRGVICLDPLMGLIICLSLFAPLLRNMSLVRPPKPSAFLGLTSSLGPIIQLGHGTLLKGCHMPNVVPLDIILDSPHLFIIFNQSW